MTLGTAQTYPFAYIQQSAITLSCEMKQKMHIVGYWMETNECFSSMRYVDNIL